MRHGYGVYTYPDGRTFFEGNWRDGKAHGQGVFRDAESEYRGEWKDDFKHVSTNPSTEYSLSES